MFRKLVHHVERLERVEDKIDVLLGAVDRLLRARAIGPAGIDVYCGPDARFDDPLARVKGAK